MKILIVDDQINVVNGICAGIDWNSIGITEVFKAYSAFEARQVIISNSIAILLCDIEMPTENGLSLYRWVKEMGFSIECIFLTAHADFPYAQEAIRLGSFDYILQPARYDEIKEALVRAKTRVFSKNELAEYSSYGKALSANKASFLDSIFRDCILDSTTISQAMLTDIEPMGFKLSMTQPIICALLHLLTWEDIESKKWEEPVLRYAVNNILTELFGVYSHVPILLRIDSGLYGLIIYEKSDRAPDSETVKKEMRLFSQICKEQLGCCNACYLSEVSTLPKLSAQFAFLFQRRTDNVAHLEGVFEIGEKHSLLEEEKTMDICIRNWEFLLAEKKALAVRDDIHRYLNSLLLENRMDAKLLKSFYQKFTQMISVVAEQKSIHVQKLLGDPEILEKYLTAYHSIEDMSDLVDYVIPCFQTANPEESDAQIHHILQYIYGHIEKDIRRTDIAREVFLNPDYLSRMFKKEMGVSLREFVITEKMKIAKNLLQSTSLPVGTIALRVGYSNFSHFSQTYKRITGCSPEDERK